MSFGGYLMIYKNYQLTSADFSVLQSIGGYLRINTNKINICTATTVNNDLGHKTLREVCLAKESPKCTSSDPYSCE